MRTMSTLLLIACSATASLAGGAVHPAARPTVGSATGSAMDSALRRPSAVDVTGVVQAGRHPSQIDVAQRGGFNVVGVMQASPDARASIDQRGGSNVALVGQTGYPGARRGAMP